MLLTQFSFEAVVAAGPAMRRFIDGRVASSMSFLDGRLDGRRALFRQNGRLAADEGFMLGERDGTCLRYHDTGTPLFADEHARGRLLRRLAWVKKPVRLVMVEDGELAIKLEPPWPVIEPRGDSAFEQTPFHGPWLDTEGRELLRALVSKHETDSRRQLLFPEVAVIAR